MNPPKVELVSWPNKRESGQYSALFACANKETEISVIVE